MADQKVNLLPTKTSPATGDKVLMIGTAEEYQMLVDDLATAVLNKLTSKTYTLDQGTKTLIAALNELNSKRKLSFYLDRYDATAIPSGADLNDYMDPGNYSSVDASNAATLINSPYNNRGFILYVLKMGTISKQIAIPTSGNEISIRTYNASWSEWAVISKSITNQEFYNDAGGESIFNIIDVNADNGLYCYRNVSDIPESSAASSEYIRIIKMVECMFIIRNNSYAYFTTASSGTWAKAWYKFPVTVVQ